MKNSVYLATATLAGSLALGSAHGQAAENGEWEFAVAPLYLWAKNISANTSAGGNELPLDLDFKDDILENLDAAFAIHFEARKDKLTLFLEYNYAKLDPSVEQAKGPVSIKADVDFEETLWEGGVTWAFAESDSTRWEVLGGLRYYDHDVEVRLTPSVSGPGLLPSKISVGDDWPQPFGGLRVITRLSERWSFRARGDIGYEDSDNQALQGIALFDYRFRDWGSVFFGYRYLDIDFDNKTSGRSQYGFDGDQQGPAIGLTFYF